MDAMTTDLLLTKKFHACVRLEKGGRTLVLDPGGFGEEDAAVGADAVLVTHEHPDHFDEGRLRTAMEANPAAEIWTLKAVADQMSAAFPGRVHTVGPGRRPRSGRRPTSGSRSRRPGSPPWPCAAASRRSGRSARA